MSDNGYGGGYDPYSNFDYNQLAYPNAPTYGGSNLGFGGGYDAALPYPSAPSYGNAGMGGDYGYLDPSNNYAYSDASGGGTRDFWDRAGDWLAKPGVQRGFAELGGLGQGLLQGSGPSLQPRNFYSALGQGMAGAQTAGAAYDTSQLSQAQLGKVGAETANLRTQSILDQQLAAGNAALLNYPGGGAAGAGQSGVPVQPLGSITTPVGGGAGGGFAAAEPHIFQYENASRNPYIGTGGADLSKAPLSDTGFPQWSGIPTPQGRSTAAGLYQITQSTWDPIATQLGIKDFSPESQRRVAEELYNQRGLQPWLVGNPAFRNAAARGLVPGQAGSAAMAGGNATTALRDTPFQMPSNMAAGLGGPGGILPQAPPAPGVTQPPAGGGLVTGLRPPAPAATLAGAPVGPAPLIASAPAAAEPAATAGTSALAAARVATAGAPNLVEGDSIAYGLQKYGGLPGNPKGGRNPQQVLDNINSNLKSDPDYYRGKTVILSPGVMNGANQIGLVPDQIQRIQNAGGKVILAGVDTGKFAGHNGTLAQMAAQAGVPFAGALPTNDVHPGPDGYRQYLARVQRGAARTGGAPGGEGSGSDIPANQLSTGALSPGAGQPDVPPPSPAAATSGPAAPAPAAAIAGNVPGGALRVSPAVTVAPAPAATAGPTMMTGTAPGVPQPPPVVQPAAAMPLAPSPAAAVPAAAGAPAAVMPGAIPPPMAPPPVPGLVGANNPLAGVDPNWLRLNQALAATYAARGRQAPGYITKAAELPIAGMQAGAEAAAKQPYALQSAAYTELLKAQYAGPIAGAQAREQFPYEMAKIYGKSAADVQAEWDKPQQVDYLGGDGNYHRDYLSPRQLAGGQGPEIMRQPGQQGAAPPAAGAPPIPAGTQPALAGAPPTSPTIKLGPVPEARIEGDKTAWTAINQQYQQANNLRPLLDQVIETANKTPSGWAVPVGAVVAKALSSVGIPISESLSNAEAMKSISQALIPTVRQPGAQSNAEMVNYLSTVPGLAQSPAGRIQIANMNKAMIDRLGDIAEVRRGNLGAADLDQKLKALDAKPLFTSQQKAVMVAGMGQRAPTPAEFDMLPIGIVFTNSKGQRVPKVANRTPAQ